MAANQHDWTFLMARSDGEAPLVVAVCGRCGLIRSAGLPQTTHERHIALGGSCPGAPQAQEPSEAATVRSA
jgi:hypothetical protein